MLLLEESHLLDSGIFLVSKNETLTYEDVFSLGENIFENKDKEIVLILCDRDVDTIISYVSALKNNKVPLLIDSSYKRELIDSFIFKYKPSYIITPKSDDFNFELYKKKTWRSLVINKLKIPNRYSIYEGLRLLLPTSGSTGDPKCVRFSSENIDSCTESICEYLNYDSSRVAISLLPLHYSYGLSVLHNCIYKRGVFIVSKLTILDKDFFDVISKYNITDISGVPFIMGVMRRLKFDFKKLKSLKYVTQAGGYFPIKEARKLFKIFDDNGIKYFTMYGQTEASPRISYLAPEYANRKEGSVGKPISCGNLSLDTSGFANGTGELIYKGKNVALGYAESYKDLVNGDQFKGILKTGDIAEIDNDGFVRILGRSKRFIKISGISVNLDSVEKKLLESFTEIVVLGKDDKLLILTERNDLDSIKEFFLNTYNFNKSTFKVKSISSIPLNSSGKTDYKLLTEEYL